MHSDGIYIFQHEFWFHVMTFFWILQNGNREKKELIYNGKKTDKYSQSGEQDQYQQ